MTIDSPLPPIEEPHLDTDMLLRELHELTGVVDEVTDTEPAADAPGADGQGDPEPEGTDADWRRDGGGDATVPDPAAVQTPVGPPPGMIEFDGRMVAIDEVKALLALGERLRTDPEAARSVSRAINPRTAPPEPEPIEFDDPQAQRLYADVQDLRAEQERQRAFLAAQADQQRQASVIDAWQSAASEFRRANPGIDDETMRVLVQRASPVFDGLAKAHGSPREGFRQGLEMTMWADPAFRAIAAAGDGGTVSPKKDRNTMKRAASALAGSSGSAPRSNPSERPSDRQGVVNKLLDIVRDQEMV